ncbi:hypothetical protein GAMM_240004 [Gammaproteobacteria bacterium]
MEAENIKDTSKKGELIFICHDESYVYLVNSYFKDKNISLDIYRDTDLFLEKLSQYAKDVKICIDNSIKPEMSSLALAKQLYESGYIRLYLLSGWDFDKNMEHEIDYLPAPYNIPKYITAIRKDEKMLESLVALAML